MVWGRYVDRLLIFPVFRFPYLSHVTLSQSDFLTVIIKKISLPAQRDEGRTKCRVSKHVAHFVARMFKAFTNLRKTTADILFKGSSFSSKKERSMIMSKMEKNYLKSEA